MLSSSNLTFSTTMNTNFKKESNAVLTYAMNCLLNSACQIKHRLIPYIISIYILLSVFTLNTYVLQFKKCAFIFSHTQNFKGHCQDRPVIDCPLLYFLTSQFLVTFTALFHDLPRDSIANNFVISVYCRYLYQIAFFYKI